MKTRIFASLALVALAAPALAEGDAAAGEDGFKKCKSCHTVVADDGTEIVKGGKVGPNLWGVIGRPVASVEGFRYGKGLLAVAEANPDLVWDEAELVAYMTSPQDWIDGHGGEGRTKMSFRLKTKQEDIAAWLAMQGPEAPAE